MKKLSIAVLLLLFVGMQSLMAQDLTVKVTPKAEGKGKIYLSGDEANEIASPETDGDAKVIVEGDYKGVGGVKVELKAKFKTDGQPMVGFGDDAYAYAHVLKAFGVDEKIVDLYLRSGRFELGFSNIKDAGQGTKLGRDNKINMQLDLKIMDMLIVRYGLSFLGFDQKNLHHDMGVGLLFAKSFDNHKIEASAAYVTDLIGARKPGDPETVGGGRDYDSLGITLAYTGSFGNIKVMPFFNFGLNGLLAKPDYAYSNPLIRWSAGVKFQLRDAADGYDIFGAGLAIGGATHTNYSRTVDGNTQTIMDRNPLIKDLRDNAAIKGLGLKVWTDALKGVMGDNYLSFWAKFRLAFDDPAWVLDVNNEDLIQRKGFLDFWAIGLEQRLVNAADASVKLKAELGFENVAPLLLTNIGYIGAINNAFKTYLQIGLEGSFTAKYSR